MISSRKIILGSAHTIDPSEDGLVLLFVSDDPVIVTVPVGLGGEFECGLAQEGEGSVTLSVAAGVSLHTRAPHTMTLAQDGFASLVASAADNLFLAGRYNMILRPSILASKPSGGSYALSALDLPAGATYAFATCCSSDGTVIGGSGDAGGVDCGIIWDRDTLAVAKVLDRLAMGETAYVNAVALDGSLAYGVANDGTDDHAVSWNPATGAVVTTFDTPAGKTNTSVTCTSADGSLVFGNADNAFGVVWNGVSGAVIRVFDQLPAGTAPTSAKASSAAGALAVGIATDTQTRAAKWNETTGAVTAFSHLTGKNQSEARCVSSDGSVAGGVSTDTGDTIDHAVWWDTATGLPTELDPLVVGKSASVFGCAPLADLLVGIATDAGDIGRAATWLKATGAVSLLEQPAITDYNEANAISADKSTIVGEGDIGAMLVYSPLCWILG